MNKLTASNMRNYIDCLELTEQMSNLKNEKRQLNTELSALTKVSEEKNFVNENSQSSDAKTPNTKYLRLANIFPILQATYCSYKL